MTAPAERPAASPELLTVAVRLSEADVARIADATVKRLIELHANQVAPAQSPPTHATVREAGKRMRRSTRWVRHLISIGRLQVTRVGDGPRPRLLIPLSAIDRLLAESTV